MAEPGPRPAIGGSGRLLPLSLTALAALLAGVLLGWLVFAPHHPDGDSPEAGFARDMSEHHAQAVEMSLLTLQRADSRDVAALAYDIATSQQNQIGQMEAWLRVWDLPTARSGARMEWMAEHEAHAAHAEPEGDAPMPGMATSEEMQQLREADGREAEILFLQLMITHHESGVTMAQAAYDLSAEAEVSRIALAMVRAQESEIAAMTAMLEERGAERPESITTESGADGGHGDHR